MELERLTVVECELPNKALEGKPEVEIKGVSPGVDAADVAVE